MKKLLFITGQIQFQFYESSRIVIKKKLNILQATEKIKDKNVVVINKWVSKNTYRHQIKCGSIS